MPTLDYCDGFEVQLYSTSAFNAGGTAMYSTVQVAAVETSIVKNGAASLKIQVAGAQSRIAKSIAAGNRQAVVGFYIRFGGAVPSSDAEVAQIFGGSNTGILMFDSATGKLGLKWGIETEGVFGPTIQADTWYLIDWKADFTGTTYTQSCRVNGDAGTEGVKTRTGQTAGDITGFGLGCPAAAPNFTVYFDDLIVGYTFADYPFGEHAVRLLKPTGDGTHNAGTNVMEDQASADINGTTVTAFDKLDEVPPENTDYVRQNGTGSGNYAEVTFADPSAADTTIWHVTAWTAIEGSAVNASDATLRVVDSTNATLVDQGGVGAISGTTRRYSVKNVPAPGGTWSAEPAGELSGLKGRVGFATDVTPIPRFLMFVLQYAAPVVNATATPSTVAAVSAVPAPTVLATATATPSTVAAVASVPPTSVADTNTGSTTTAATSAALTRGTIPSANELELLFISWGTTGQADPLGTFPAGWAQVTNTWVERASGATEGSVILYRKTTGSEGTTAIGSITGMVSTKVAWVYVRVKGEFDPATTAPQASTPAQGAVSPASSPALTVTWGEAGNLWFSFLALSQITASSGDPASYGNALESNSDVGGAASTNTITRVLRRLTGVATEDPGDFTVPSVAWIATTLAVRPDGAVQASAVATPATVAAVSAVPAPTILGGAIATPSTAAAIADVPAPTIIALSDATATPATVAAVAAVPAPSVLATAVASPGAVAAVTAVDAPTIAATAVASPTVVAGVSTVPAPTILATAVASPATVAAIAAVNAPTLSSNQTATPSTVAAIAAVNAPTVSGTAVTTPNTVAAVVAIAPTVSADAIATPPTVAAVVAVNAPTVLAASLTAPSTVAAVAAVNAPVVLAAALATPPAVAAIAAVNAPTVSGTSVVTPASVAALADVPAPSVLVGGAATAAPSTVAAVAAVPTPAIAATAQVTGTTVEVNAAIDAPTVSGTAVTTPSSVDAISTVPAPTIDVATPAVNATATPATVSALVLVPFPDLRGTAVASPPTVAAIALVGASAVLVPGAAEIGFLELSDAPPGREPALSNRGIGGIVVGDREA